MNDSTRDIILKKAHKLFAEKGYNAVSVREIAKECDVNLAAINYHFKNKESLYYETIKSSVALTEESIHNLYTQLEHKTIDNITIAVFNHFKENSEDLRTGFKLIMTSDKTLESMVDDLSHFKGPPGGEYFYKCLINDFPNASEEDLQFGVRVIFTQVIHKAILTCSHHVCSSLENHGLSKEVFEDDLKRLVKLIKAELSSK